MEINSSNSEHNEDSEFFNDFDNIVSGYEDAYSLSTDSSDEEKNVSAIQKSVESQ